MYLITAYFDSETNRRLQRYIDRIEKESGNTFMSEHKVPPHLTISSIEARNAELLMEPFANLQGKIESGKVQFVSVGALFPYVLYAAPVLDQYLQKLQDEVFATVKDIPDVKVGRFYKPYQWLPHVTLGKTLEKEQMQRAFEAMQENFVPFCGQIVELGLARVNPHEDICRFIMVPF